MLLIGVPGRECQIARHDQTFAARLAKSTALPCTFAAHSHQQEALGPVQEPATYIPRYSKYGLVPHAGRGQYGNRPGPDWV